MNLKKLKFAVIFFVFIFVSCSKVNTKMSKTYFTGSKGTIAVLPFDNHSNELTAETMLREMIYKGLRSKGWQVISNEEVDKKIAELGITDGGQLNAVSIKDLGEKLQTEYLLYGTINDFKLQNIGYIIKKNVELNVKIVKVNDEMEVFNETGVGSDLKIFLKSEEAKKAFIEYNALKLVENIMKRPLYKEAEKAVSQILNKIP